MKFEWDDNKNAKNYKKHGIHFRTAERAFFDPYRLERFDFYHSIFEDRFILIGDVKELNNVVHLVYTMREDRIRIITARFATKKERKDYYDYKRRN